jgi:N-acetylglucosaminyldiphosphoundecaprenol N-acetyl-beta-D-mannosaminyltransferase
LRKFIANGALTEMFERNVYCLLGLVFDAVDMADTVSRIRDAAARRQPLFLSTPNLNFLIACRNDKAFRDSVIRSDLSIADGMPIVWMAKWLRIPIRGRVAGSDVFETLRNDRAAPLSVYFFGGTHGVAEAACRRLTAENRGLTCSGHEFPGFGSVEDMSTGEIVQRINASKADFLVVSLGARKGQAWIERNRSRLTVPVVSHLGAVMNFVAGTVDRAPERLRKGGLEWLWRIKEEPMLWRRYVRDGLILLSLLVTRVLPYVWYLRRNQPGMDQLNAAAIETRHQTQDYVVRLHGAWTERNLAPLRDCFSLAVQTGKDIRLEMAGVSHVDSAFVGLVQLLQGQQDRHGKQLFVVSPQKAVRRIFKYCCAEYLCLHIA